MIPKIIHFVLPEYPTPAQSQAVELATRVNPDCRIQVWQDPLDPEGFRLSGYWAKVNSGAQLADLARIEVVYMFGGVYFDSDVFAIAPLARLLDGTDFFVASEGGRALTNAVFGARRQHPYMDELVQHLLNSEPDWTLPPNVTTGPRFWADALGSKPGLTVVPRQTFYPYNHGEVPVPPVAGTLALHAWDGSWTQSWRGLPWHHHKRVLRSLGYRLNRALGIAKGLNTRSMLQARLVTRVLTGWAHAKRALRPRKTNRGEASSRSLLGHGGLTPNCEIKQLRPHIRSGDFVIEFVEDDVNSAIHFAHLVAPFGRVGVVHWKLANGELHDQWPAIRPLHGAISLGSTIESLDYSLQLAVNALLPIALLRCEGLDSLKHALKTLPDVFKSGTVRILVIRPGSGARCLSDTDTAEATNLLHDLGYYPSVPSEWSSRTCSSQCDVELLVLEHWGHSGQAGQGVVRKR